MELTTKLYDDLMRMAKKRMRKSEYLLRYLAIDEPEDLVHGFFLSSYFDEPANDAYQAHHFTEYCADMIRDGKRRRDAGVIITNSQNMALDNAEDGYKADDLIDGYMYRQSEMIRRINPGLSDKPYRSPAGHIDYDAMLEDMQKEMCKDDRLFCVRNKKTNRVYQCGNPRAIPLVLLSGGM